MVLQLPNVFGEACFRPFYRVREGRFVVSKSLFEYGFRCSRISPHHCTCSDISVVHHGSLGTLTIKGAVILVGAVAVICNVRCNGFCQYLLIVLRNDRFHVGGAAVADL